MAPSRVASTALIIQHIGDDDAGAFATKRSAQLRPSRQASNDGGTVLEFHTSLLIGVEISAVRFQHEGGDGQMARAAQGKEG